MYKFSIVTCTYNSAEFLNKNIDSVAAQTFKDFEHIFIDGFSTDETINIINEYKKKNSYNVKLLQLSPKGISNAMNGGIKAASGEYLIHLHSDDSFFDDKVLSDTANYLNNNNELDWVYGKCMIVEESGKVVGIHPKRFVFQNSSKGLWGRYFLKFYNFVPHQAVFMKKTVFEKFGFFNEKISSAMDSEFWLRIRNKTNWKFYNRVISNYCIRVGAESSDLKNRERNQKNYRLVQSRYLNMFERPFAYIFNLIIEKRNKTYR